MKDYIKVYTLTLTAVGPVFIGSGKEIHKKEYLLDRNKNNAKILSIADFYLAMQKKGKGNAFEAYMMDQNMPLFMWVKENGVNVDVNQNLRYSVAFAEPLENIPVKGMQIMECVKDAYGKPYVPGSSVKGMLRTLLLAEGIRRQSNLRDQNVSRIEIASGEKKPVKRDQFLKRQVTQLEHDCFHTLNRSDGAKETRFEDAVNDELSGLIISDSKPLTMKDIVLCRKVDVGQDGEKNKINLIRECIRPGTKISSTISIDTSICRYDTQDVLDAIEHAGTVVYDNFLCKFHGVDRPLKNTVWLGGGSGFVQKTLVYNLFPGHSGVELTKRIFEATGVPREHKHYRDQSVSPHMLKCTECNGKLMQFGQCAVCVTPQN